MMISGETDHGNALAAECGKDWVAGHSTYGLQLSTYTNELEIECVRTYALQRSGVHVNEK